MSLLIECEGSPLSPAEIQALWTACWAAQGLPQQEAALRCVSREEIQRLNREYRGKDAPTNILTFTYPADELLAAKKVNHDIAVCLPVVQQEAFDRGLGMREYTAWVLVHGFLHATGLDHERSAQESTQMQDLEQQILRAQGFITAAS